MKNINDYDKFALIRQIELKKGEKLPHKYVEKPMMQSMLPNLHNQSVLLLGCGTGEESVMIKESGAKEITGIDISVESIKLANETYPEHKFEVGDMNNLKFKDSSFDFIYSSLCLHYSSDPASIYAQIFRILKPGGLFLFSIGHPIRRSSQIINIDNTDCRISGFSVGRSNAKIYGNYLSFIEHEHTFPSGEILKFWVGPPSLHFKLLKNNGFDIENFVESSAIEDCKEINEHYYNCYKEFPQFIGFLARRPLVS